MNDTAQDVAVVIVTYNSGAEIGECLDAALLWKVDIVVVDNASTDDTRTEVSRRGIRLIANPDNRGFAAAVNQGFRAATAPFVLLLNPDAVLRAGLDSLRQQCEVRGAAAAAGRLVDENGEPQAGFSVRRLPTPAALCFETLGINRLWPRNPVNWRFRCFDIDLLGDWPIAVEQPAGAFLMVRRDAWEQLGGFDERFHPIWFEDVDFCCRLKAAGLTVSYVPKAVAKHTGAHSIRPLLLEHRQIYWYGSLLRYAAKHYSTSARRLVCVSVMAGSVIHSLTGIFSRHGRKNVKVYGRVIRLAGRYV